MDLNRILRDCRIYRIAGFTGLQDLQDLRDLQDCRIAGLQDCRIYRICGIYRIAGLQDLRDLRDSKKTKRLFARRDEIVRSFTDEEREIIKQKIIDRGKDCFARYGIKKTGIEDLTAGIGIAKSSFYSFFNSKEALFLQIFKEEREALKDSILENSFLKYRTEPDKAIRAYLKYVLQIVDNNPVWRKVFIEKEQVGLTISRLSEEEIKNIRRENLEIILPFFEEWKEAGLLIDKPAKVLAGAVQEVLSLIHLRNEIGEEDFPEIMEIFIDLLAEGILKKDA